MQLVDLGRKFLEAFVFTKVVQVRVLGQSVGSHEAHFNGLFQMLECLILVIAQGMHASNVVGRRGSNAVEFGGFGVHLQRLVQLPRAVQ